MKQPLADLYILWGKFRNVPTTARGSLEEAFLHFGKGAALADVWRWFEDQNERFSVGEAMSGIRRTDSGEEILPTHTAQGSQMGPTPTSEGQGMSDSPEVAVSMASADVPRG